MTHTDGFKNIEELINRFGGMRSMARKLDVPVSTIQGWKKRDTIPSDRLSRVIRIAKANNISLYGYEVPANTSNENKQSSTQATENIGLLVSTVKPKLSSTQKQDPKITLKSEAGLKFDMVKRSAITTVSILAILGGLGYFLFGQNVKQVITLAENESELQSRFSSFEATVTEGMNSLGEQMTGVAAAVGVERTADGNIILNNDLSLSERVTNLESRLRASGEEIDLGQLISKFDNLTQTFQGQGGETADAMNDLKSVVDLLQGRIESLDVALAEAKTNNEEIAKSLENVSGRDLGAAAMLLALTQMRSSLDRSQPFADDLAILQQLVGEDDPELTQAIEKLAPYAQSGVLTPEGLSTELKGVTGDILAAALRGENISIQDKVMARVGEVLSIKKDGIPVIGIEEQVTIAKAQKALDAGDVSTALAELNKLEGEAAQSAIGFKTQAAGTLNAENTIALMMEKLIQKLQNPDELKAMLGGKIIEDKASGIIILE
jgi:hypothetical protein